MGYPEPGKRFGASRRKSLTEVTYYEAWNRQW